MAAAAAPAVGKGKRKRSLSEDDVYILLHRYAPGTILTALQEVAHHAEGGRRIDWKAVVRKSATGITSAREYQMLWRHFAYNHDLDEAVDASDQPLGDDSDLELEPEPVPNPSEEALSEASALAKALISGSSRDQASGQRVNLDAPVLNPPNEKIVRVPSEKLLGQGHRITNVTGPVSNSKQASHLGPAPGSLDPNGPSKKKKKPKAWSKEEDADLAAGVQKFGEGNWDYISHKCKFDRTPDQLSQRWALICKRPGGSTKPASTKGTVASSEERKNTLKALSMAVGPIRRSSSMLRPGAYQQGIQHKSAVFAPKIPEVRSAATPSPALALPAPVPAPVPVPMPLPVKVQVNSPLPQGQQAPIQCAPPKSANASNKTRKKQPAQPNPPIGLSTIKEAAFAAGARLAPAEAAADFLKVAQNMRSQVTGSSKSSAGPKAPTVVVEPGTQTGSSQHLEPPNTSTPKSGPSVLTTHATEQGHGASEVAVVNPPGPSDGAHSLETKKASSTTPVSGSCDIEEKEDDSTFCVITIDDLFPEDAIQPETVDLKAKQPEIVDQKANQQVEIVSQRAKQPETVDPKAKQPETADPQAKQPENADPKAKQPDALNPKVEMVDSKDKDMLEFDQYVASQGGVNTDHLDKSKTGGSASQAQGLGGSQKKQVKLVPTVGKGNPVLAAAPATVKRIKTSVPHLVNPVPAGTPRGIVGTVNANAPNKTLVRKAAAPAPAPAGVQPPPLKKHAVNIKGNQAMQPGTAVAGSVVPASSQVSVAVNGASKANPLSSGQASTVVNIGGKANAPSSGQASTVVNVGSKANPPSSGQASTVVNVGGKANPPSSGQVSTVVNIGGKANPPSSAGQASTAVNIGGKVNPPSSAGQASTAVNIGGKVNPPSSSQASTAVNIGGKVNPPSSSQASTAVNVGGKANPPSSGQASTVVNIGGKANPPSSSQVSTVVNVGSKANPPFSGQVSTVVNIGGKANPPSSIQASAVVNVGSKANPPSSGQASTAVNGANRAANPQSSSQASVVVNGANRAANPQSSRQVSVAANGSNRAANPPSSSSQAGGAAASGAANKSNPPGAAPKQ